MYRTLEIAQLIKDIISNSCFAPESLHPLERSTYLQVPQCPQGNIPVILGISVSHLPFWGCTNSDWTSISSRFLALFAIKGRSPTISLRSPEEVIICQWSERIDLIWCHWVPKGVISLTGPYVPRFFSRWFFWPFWVSDENIHGPWIDGITVSIHVCNLPRWNSSFLSSGTVPLGFPRLRMWDDGYPPGVRYWLPFLS